MSESSLFRGRPPHGRRLSVGAAVVRLALVASAFLVLAGRAAAARDVLPNGGISRADNARVALPSPRDSADSAAENPVALDQYVTTATRTPSAPQMLGTATQAVTAADLSRSQVTSVADALSLVAGAPPMVSGAAGSAASLFLRGANSNQTLFLVDGIRFNDSNTDYQVFLGGGSFGACDRLEVARGPQSTLYGAEAIGGVIALQSMRGAGTPTATLGVEAGSFGSMTGSIAGQGARGAAAWNFSARGGHTENARPNNHFDSANAALRLDRTVSEAVAIGATLRWFHSDLHSPGDRFTADPNNRETENNVLATLFADVKIAADWTAHVTLGGQDRRYVNDTPAPNPPFDFPGAQSVITNRRAILDAQTTYTGIERNRITVGSTAETHFTRNTGFGAINDHQALRAVFAEDEFSPFDPLHLTAGVRNDHFDTFGDATTGRGTLAWLAVPRTLKLRASLGTGFRSPSFLDLYGRDPYYVGNPALRPERSHGVDVGADYYLPKQAGSVGVTWFETKFSNLIEYDFGRFPSTVVNIGEARTRGVEVLGRAQLGGVEASVSYTYLHAIGLHASGNDRLLRRPLHQVAADVHGGITRTLTLGLGLQYVGHRDDVDAQTYAFTVDPDYLLVRVYGAWQVTPGLTLKTRIENALDRSYEAVNGYPALGAALFAGLEWHF